MSAYLLAAGTSRLERRRPAAPAGRPGGRAHGVLVWQRGAAAVIADEFKPSPTRLAARLLWFCRNEAAEFRLVN